MIWRGIFRQFTLARINGDRSLSAGGDGATGGTRVIDKSRFFTGLFSLPSLFLSLPGKKVKNFFACPLEEAVGDPIL
ncbi:hypothetical protein B1209_23120 [Raoultella planticola]|nr:hypothetical protein B1209_23120 [Raoultella planticola]OAZ84044.1 hypothetical protein AYO05_14055 [Raoultella planticola]OAZ84462.1 hypothetical protein AYO04_02250 [Raoultella planticola]OZP73172.1 hypothetical protein CIG23_14895 [Raoultella planticola]TDV05891.1 hypothetical protein DFO76_106212 [Raoultella planticola]